MAAATNGGWEVVGTKKSKPQGKAPLSKSKKKAFVESMPRISPSCTYDRICVVFWIVVFEDSTVLTCDFNRCSMGQLIAQPIEWDTSVVSSKTAIQRFIEYAFGVYYF